MYRDGIIIGMVLIGVWAPIHAGDNSLGLKVPPGFEISEYSDSSLANDIFSMALDPKGRVLVSGRGYVRLLVDDHNAGKATRAIDLADGPKEGAQGLLWEGSWLYFTADGGLHRYRINSAGDKAEGPPELIRAMKTGGEHCAHAIRRGPDGWLYVLCGNSTGINGSYAQLPTSPIQNPVAGCVLRFSPDLKTSEIVADGFRNPYDMDFNPDGELFTFDSDNERCVSLPWYESTRFYQAIPGGHYGWLAPQRAETWRLPPYFFDVVAPIAYLGRGSPTGVACYRHVQFPEEYQGGMFLCDWTFGKVYFLSLKRSGTTYTSRKQVFLESVGDNGFAPTAIAVHPKTGDLFISIGGRGTRGAVYRIRYPQRSGSINASALAQLQVKPRILDWKEKMAEPRKYSPPAKDDIPAICKLIRSEKTAPELRLIGVRIIQLALGDLVHPKQKGTVWEGYTFRQEPPSIEGIIPALVNAFPSGHADLDREISRTLAALEDEGPKTLAKVLRFITSSSDPVEDIHYLIVAARLKAPRSAEHTQCIARALLALDRKLTERKMNRDRNWPLRIAEMHAELARKDPRLNGVLLGDPEFGRPDHALFARCPGFDRPQAAKIFLTRIQKSEDYPWTSSLVDLIGSLPDEQCMPVIRELWGQAGLDEAILPILGRRPQLVDQEKFIEGLNSPKLAAIRLSLQALEKLSVSGNGPQILALVRCLRSLPEGREENRLREQVVRHLQRITDQDKLGGDYQAWTEWFAKKYPDLATRLENADGVDITGWNRRLGQLDWSGGVAERGGSVYTKANCSSCHSGAQALGPDLRGAANRFSRADLFTAILQPSKDISPRYRTTLIGTDNGKMYQGLIIYEAVDGVILQTGPATTVRIPGDQIATRRITSTSLMPAGLLDKLTDRDIVDLYAYLKSLK